MFRFNLLETLVLGSPPVTWSKRMSDCLSPETFMARIRDSVRALFRFSWEVVFDWEALEEIWPQLMVSGLPDGTVGIGKRRPRSYGLPIPEE